MSREIGHEELCPANFACQQRHSYWFVGSGHDPLQHLEDDIDRVTYRIFDVIGRAIKNQ